MSEGGEGISRTRRWNGNAALETHTGQNRQRKDTGQPEKQIMIHGKSRPSSSVIETKYWEEGFQLSAALTYRSNGQGFYLRERRTDQHTGRQGRDRSARS